MSRFVLIALALLLATVTGADAEAQVRARQQPKPQPSGTGVDRNGIKSRPAPRVPTFTIPQRGYYYNYYGPGYYSGYYSGYGGGFYDYDYCPYCNSRYCRGRCRLGGSILFPAYANGSVLYGPGANQRFLGVGGGNQNQGGGGNARPRLADIPEVPPQLSNPSARAKAWKFVEYGDRQFKKGDYSDALSRYRKASRQAGDVGDIYFRQALAYVGMGKYPEATSEVKQGLSLKPDWPESGFVLEELYPTDEAKREVFRGLHAHLNEMPNDPDALFMTAVLQHFDGQQAAAEVKFRRVVDLLGLAEHARAFLPPAKVAGGKPAAGNPPAGAGKPAGQQGGGFGNLPPVPQAPQ